MSVSSDQQDEILRRSISRRDTDGRLKLKGLSKATREELMLLHGKLIGLGELSRKELLEGLEAFLNETDGETGFESMTAEDGHLDLRLRANPDLVRVMAEEMSKALEEQGGSNYVEFCFRSAQNGKGYTLLVQRQGAKTPAQKRAALRSRLQDVVTTWSSTHPRNTISKNKAANVLRVILEEDEA